MVMSHSILLDCGTEARIPGSMGGLDSTADQNDISPGAIDP